MTEQVIVNIDRPNVGIRYLPVSREAELADEIAAVELSIHALTQHALVLRAQLGRNAPPVLVEVIKAETYREFG